MPCFPVKTAFLFDVFCHGWSLSFFKIQLSAKSTVIFDNLYQLHKVICQCVYSLFPMLQVTKISVNAALEIFTKHCIRA